MRHCNRLRFLDFITKHECCLKLGCVWKFEGLGSIWMAVLDMDVGIPHLTIGLT